MDFTIERIIVLNNKINNNKNNKNGKLNKEYWSKYLNNSVLELLNKRKRSLEPEIIDLDNYKKMSLREEIIKKRKKNAKKDDIDWKISDLVVTNNHRGVYLDQYKSYPLYEYYNNQYNIVRCTLFYKEEALFQYLKFREKVYNHIIELLIISKNINNYQKKYPT